MIHFFFHIYVNFSNLRTDVLHDSKERRLILTAQLVYRSILMNNKKALKLI